MCLDIRKRCECGAHNVQFHLRDNVMLPEVIARLWCPTCAREETDFDRSTMLDDNGWTIEYDMVLARMLAAQHLGADAADMEPETIFIRGYACWQELYPGEQQDIKEEREQIIGLLQEDQKKYLETIQNWNIKRVERLKAEGWRKAQGA
jgi:hypothetical protein